MYFAGPGSFLVLASGPVSLIYGVRCTWARAVTFLALGAIPMCLLGAGLVRAWSPSYVL